MRTLSLVGNLVPPASNFKTFHFLFMGAFMYVVRVPKQTAIISTYDIN